MLQQVAIVRMICLSKKVKTLYNQLNWGGGNESYPPFLLTSKIVYYVRYSRDRIKVNRLKIFSKNGEISGNAKGHDDLEHPFLQMMQQFVKDGKQTEFEKCSKKHLRRC